MKSDRLSALFGAYRGLRLAVVGDFCLDRYLEIDPRRQETSLETGRPVHNVVAIRAQAGGAGTILNNLAALGVGKIYPVGFCGEDGEGFELQRALASLAGVRMDYFSSTPRRRTFTYCKPLLCRPGLPPEELDRLDTKNWQPTPDPEQSCLVQALEHLAPRVHALILLEQVEEPQTGVLCRRVLETVAQLARQRPSLIILADSRRSLREFPPVIYKMNAREFGRLTGLAGPLSLDMVRQAIGGYARRLSQPVFVTLAEQGLAGALPDGTVEHVPAWPLRGPIDIVGAGDAVSANLVAALAAGASLREAMEIANAAASIVIHQLGTTGVATPAELAALLCGGEPAR